MDLDVICKQVVKLVNEVGAYIIEQRESFDASKIEHKSARDLVSFVDKEAEKQLVAGLSNIFPEAGFIAEEETANNNNERFLWIVDPLDGTTNFMHKVSPHAISIALADSNQVILGVVYELGHKECFYGHKDSDVFCNGKKIKVSESNNLSQALVATGMPVVDLSRLDEHLQVVKQIVEKSHGIRRHGSAASDLIYVACGRFDGFYEYGLNAWDVAAGAFLVKQAGGMVSDFSGNDNYLFGRELVCGTPGVYKEMLSIIKDTM